VTTSAQRAEAGRRPAWPDAVWDAAVLRALDARARGELEAAGKLREVRAGDTLYRAGDPADVLYAVASGTFALASVRRGDGAASVIRRAARGHVFGEEGTVLAFGVRQMDARCEEAGIVAELPVTVLRRALARSGAGDHAARFERALRRALTDDLLRTTSFTRNLPDRDVAVLLDAARHAHVARGEHLYREGDASTEAYLVADGLLQVQTTDAGAPRVEAYLGRGDLFGDDELEDHSRRRVGVVAAGPSWVIAVPRDVFLAIARRERDALVRARRVHVDAGAPLATSGTTTAHVFKDVYRLRVARSLLVIDQDSCVRCGHCAWSCASTHADGISRLVRRGDKLAVVKADARAAAEQVAPLLVPNSCQHCKNPSCMIDCPTGAIGRDARGEVFIREDLCTGCGSCAKGCPWDNIQIAPRSDPKSAYPEVAVKCDLCSESAAGPACVAACPTEALVRIDPNVVLDEIASRAPRAILPPRTAAWPWVTGAAVAAAGLATAHLSAWTSGVLAGGTCVLLAAYAGTKRAPGLVARLPFGKRIARAAYVAHLALGTLALRAALAHTHGRVPSSWAGALTLAIAATLATGVLGGVLHAVVPRRLTRLERSGMLPEDHLARAREHDEQLFARLTGRGELVKTLYARVLAPYRSATYGPLALALSGRSLSEERRRVARQIEGLLGGRRSEKHEGLDELVRLVVERRALASARLLSAPLRAFLPVHLAAVAASVVLLLAHVAAVVAMAVGAR